MADLAATDHLLDLFGNGLLSAQLTPADIFQGDPARNARRFALYRGNLGANWERSLANAFPVLRQMLGEDFFTGLSRDYGRRVGSLSGDLNVFGAGLADFLGSFAPTQPYPYLPDLAHLEWAVHRAYYAANGAPLLPAALAEAEALETLPCRLRPGHALVSSPWAIEALWQAHQTQPVGPLPAEVATPCRALVFRPGWRVAVRTVSTGEWAALTALQTPTPLAAALEAGFDADPDFDPGSTLQAWLEQSLLATATPDEETP